MPGAADDTGLRGISESPCRLQDESRRGAGRPWDVEGYRRLDRAFPMTRTEDQLYGEFDFEAYRELGWAVTKAALDARLDLGPESEEDASADGRRSRTVAGAPARTPAEATVPRPFSP